MKRNTSFFIMFCILSQRVLCQSTIEQDPSQAVCYAPTPLGSAFPRGMFGAVEDGQEEAVRFFEAWKAEVLPLKEGFESWIRSYFSKTSISWMILVDLDQVIKEVPADRLLVWQVKQGWEPLCQVRALIQKWNSRFNPKTISDGVQDLMQNTISNGIQYFVWNLRFNQNPFLI